MNKEDALKTILHSANLYKENLEGKNLLFIYYVNQGHYEFIETHFSKSNFHHLTGTKLNTNLMKSPTDFYNSCIKNKLSSDCFEIRDDGTTKLKLTVLPSLMQLHSNANIIGDFDQSRVFLRTDKLAGNIYGSIGFRKKGNLYFPNTVLFGDIRKKVSKPYGKIILIYAKTINQKKYHDVIYCAKRLKGEVPKLPGEIENLIERCP